MKISKLLLSALATSLLIPSTFLSKNVEAKTNDNKPEETEKIGKVKDDEDTGPMMGWSSWNAFRIDIHEDMIQEQADIMAENGMKEAGYEYINIDDGFFGGRDENDVLYPAAEKFPSGMKATADYIHDKGFKAGIYTDAGIKRCASIWDDDPNFPEGGGSYGYRDIDFDTFFNDWGYDFVKVDWCGGKIQGLDQEEEYTDIAQHILETNKDVEWEICSWEFPGEWATDIASHWRISQDIDPTFASITNIIDKNAGLAEHAGPGHYNHMDMLQVGNGMSYEEDKSHFSMWSIMSSPLLTGNDLRDMSDETLEILTNEEVIAVNQDSLGLQAERVAKSGNQEVWSKPVKNYEKAAVALFNRSNSPKEITVNFADIGLEGEASIRDLWEHADKGNYEDSYTVEVPGHGVVMLEIEGDTLVDHPELNYDLNSEKDLSLNKVRETVQAIKNDELKLEENYDYIIRGSEIILSKEYLESLEEGIHYLSVDYGEGLIQKVAINIRIVRADYPYTKTTATAGAYEQNNAREGDPNFAVDNNQSTIFHSPWAGTDKSNLWITLELDEVTKLDALRYLSRSGGSNGIVNEYTVETSLDNEKWKEVSTGQWTSEENKWSIAKFDETEEAKYVRLTANSTYGNPADKYMSANEIRLRMAEPESTVAFTSENLGINNDQMELAKLFNGNLESNSGHFPFASNQLPKDKEVNIQYDFGERRNLHSIKFSTNYGQDQGIKKFKLATWDEEKDEWNQLEKEYTLDWTTEGENELGETLEVGFDLIQSSKIKIIITDAGLTWDNKLAMREIEFNTSEIDDTANQVIALIDELPALSELKLTDKEAVESARTAYDELSGEAKALVTNIDKLEEVETQLADLEQATVAVETAEASGTEENVNAARKLVDALADSTAKVDLENRLEAIKVEAPGETEEEAKRAAVLVDRMIYRLPNVAALTLEDAEVVEAVRAAYEALSEEAKAHVENLRNLELREERLEALADEEIADKFAVLQIQRKIYRLPNAHILTVADAAQVEAVRAKYEALNDASKEIFSSQYLKNLELRETKLDKLAAKEVDRLIAQFHKADEVTEEYKEKVKTAREAYDALAEEVKALVHPANVGKLERAEAKIAEVDK